MLCIPYQHDRLDRDCRHWIEHLWERKTEAAAPAKLALNPHSTLMRLHNMLRNREPQPRPTRLSGASLVHPIKPLKQAAQMFRGYSRTEIFDAEPYVLRSLQDGRTQHDQRSIQRLAGERLSRTDRTYSIVQRILDQVAEHLDNCIEVRDHFHVRKLADLQHSMLLPSQRRHRVLSFLDQDAHLDRLRAQLLLPRV